MKITTGRQLREYRKKQGWDIWDMACALDSSISDVANAEKNPNRKLNKRLQQKVNKYSEKVTVWNRIRKWIKDF